MGPARSVRRSRRRAAPRGGEEREKDRRRDQEFAGPSLIDDLEKAIGQFVLYHDVLANLEPERVLYLAVTEFIYLDLFAEPVGQLLLEKRRIRLMVFNPETEVIQQWTPEPPIVR
ncbi:element excision factor XisH family protein [Sorangium sp. So ce1389]